jgi:hypothetical protein
MARNLFIAELGFGVRDTNTDTGTDIIQGAGAPPGTSGISDTAAIGSLWMDRTNGVLYQKQADTSSATDWLRLTDESIYTALGISYGDTDMGTFTGDIITDNVATKVALQELETELVDTRQNVDDLITLSGVAENATDLGTFTGAIIPDNSDNKEAFQALETAIEAGNFTDSVAIPAATPTSVGAVLVDDFNYIEYEVWIYENAAEATKKEGFKFTVLHNGTSGADASSVDDSLHTKLKIGKVAGLSVSAVLSGTGAAQTVAMQITTTNASTVKVRRTAIPV